MLDGKGRIVDTRTFNATVPAARVDAPAATAALDQAFSTAAMELVAWTSRTIADQFHPPAGAPKGPVRSKDKKG